MFLITGTLFTIAGASVISKVTEVIGNGVEVVAKKVFEVYDNIREIPDNIAIERIKKENEIRKKHYQETVKTVREKYNLVQKDSVKKIV